MTQRLVLLGQLLPWLFYLVRKVFCIATLYQLQLTHYKATALLLHQFFFFLLWIVIDSVICAGKCRLMDKNGS